MVNGQLLMVNEMKTKYRKKYNKTLINNLAFTANHFKSVEL